MIEPRLYYYYLRKMVKHRAISMHVAHGEESRRSNMEHSKIRNCYTSTGTVPVVLRDMYNNRTTVASTRCMISISPIKVQVCTLTSRETTKSCCIGVLLLLFNIIHSRQYNIIEGRVLIYSLSRRLDESLLDL